MNSVGRHAIEIKCGRKILTTHYFVVHMYHSENVVILNMIPCVGHRYDNNSISQGAATADSG